MKVYSEKLKLQNICFCFGILALVLIQILSYCGILKSSVQNEAFADFWSGFISGAALGVTIFLAAKLVINLLALRSEDRLKKRMAEEMDERLAAITEKGKSAGATTFIIVALPASVICGYFSATVFITAIVFLLVLSLFIGGGKLYYCKKF